MVFRSDGPLPGVDGDVSGGRLAFLTFWVRRAPHSFEEQKDFLVAKIISKIIIFISSAKYKIIVTAMV